MPYEITNRLREGPHPIERSVAPLIESSFPEFEKFRSEFLIPLTNSPVDANWRFDTHPSLEQAGMACFGIMKSLNFIYINKDLVQTGDPQQRFKNIYFHFGLIFECINSLCRNILIIEDELEIKNLNKALKISRRKLVIRYFWWVVKEYDNSFHDLLETGKPIFYYPQKEKDYLSQIFSKKKIRAYRRFVKKIFSYRNFYTHNPGVDIFTDGTNHYTVKKREVIRNRTWAGLRTLFQEDPSLFESPTEMVNRNLNEVCNILNNIWPTFSERMNRIYQAESFNNAFRNYTRNINN